MRKGFSLTELLAAIIILSFVSIVLAELFVTIVSDIPRSYQVVQANTSLLNMLRQMHEDINIAKGLPESSGKYTTDKDLLLIELANSIICYQLKDGKVLRRKLATAQEKSGEDMRVWSVPHAKVEWQVWRKDRDGYALEVKTHIEHETRGRWQKKMANSHLYFVGAYREVFK